MQTLAAYFASRPDRLPAAEERLFSVEAQVQVLCHCHWQSERKQSTTLMIVHGLEGSSTSQYVIGTANKAWAAGMNVIRMNVRNCGGTESLSATLYHSGLSADVGAVACALIEEEELSSIALAGFSMGGNLVLKIAGEWGTEAPKQVRAIAAVSPAIDLSASADALHRWDNRLYEWWFLIALAGKMRRKAELFPEKFRAYPLASIRSIRDFDDRITARYFGFNGAEDYYRKAQRISFCRRNRGAHTGDSRARRSLHSHAARHATEASAESKCAAAGLRSRWSLRVPGGCEWL